MEPDAWLAFYRSDLQGLYALGVFPVLWLLHRAVAGPPGAGGGGGADPACAGFVRAWCLLFAVETLVDPWAAGPLAAWLGARGVPGASSVLPLLFVLLGDFRVLWLVLHVADPSAPRRAALRAALATAAVPGLAYALHGGLGALVGGLPGQALWLTHELLFLALAAVLGRVGVPRLVDPSRPAPAAFVRAVLGFVAGYYGLWALADVLILAGVPEGWGLRVVPNQLYYGLTVPYVAWRFFRAPASGAPAPSGSSAR